MTRSSSAWASCRSRSTYYYSAPPTYSVPEIGLTGTSDDTFTVLQETRTRTRVWLIVSHPQPSTDAVIASLEGAGRLAEVAGFTDVDVYLYEIGQDRFRLCRRDLLPDLLPPVVVRGHLGRDGRVE